MTLEVHAHPVSPSGGMAVLVSENEIKEKERKKDNKRERTKEGDSRLCILQLLVVQTVLVQCGKGTRGQCLSDSQSCLCFLLAKLRTGHLCCHSLKTRHKN